MGSARTRWFHPGPATQPGSSAPSSVVPGSRASFDTSKPDGTPRKLLDVGKLKRAGWRPRIGLKRGIADTYHWYLENVAEKERAKVG